VVGGEVVGGVGVPMLNVFKVVFEGVSMVGRRSNSNTYGFGSHVMKRCRVGVSKVLVALVLIAVVAAAVYAVMSLQQPAPSAPATQTVAQTQPTSSTTATQSTKPAVTEVGSKKVLRVGIGIDVDTLDPAGQTTTTISNIVQFYAEPLFMIDEGGKIVPLLAESYEVSPDAKVYTVKLRKGIYFHDGTPFNATAVKFTFERLLDPKVKVPARGNFLVIDKVEVVDEYTVRFELKYPFAPFLTVLSTTQSCIISPKAAKELGDKISVTPYDIGTGPFKFKEWVKGDRVVLIKNERYWNGTPYFDEVVFKVVPDHQTREAMLLAGDLDIIIQPPATDVEMLKRRGDLKVVELPSTRVMGIWINTQKGPLKDVRVRQALNYAVDKEAIIKNVLFGLGVARESPIPSFTLGFKKLGPYPYDPEKARKLLAEAGYPNGFEVTLITPSGRYLFDKQIAEAVAQYLRDVGIKVTLKTYDWPTYVTMLFKPLNESELELFLVGFAATGGADPHFYLYLRYHTSQFPPNGFNPSFYSNPEVDKLLEDGMKIPDPEKRREIYEKANEIIWNEAPEIFLHIQYFVVVMKSNLEGVRVFPYEMIEVRNARFVG